MIASDSQNPEYYGAFNPDARLAVQFYEKPYHMEFLSEKEQRPIYENRVFVKIFTPGEAGKLNIIDTLATKLHENRFPHQWAAFKNRPGADTRYMGTPITEWPRISPSQAEELKGIKFFTVESISQASDAQLQGVGMIAGVSSFTLRDEAKRFLMVADAASKLSEADKKAKEADEKLAAANAEILLQKEQHALDMAELREEMKMFMRAAKSQAEPEPERKVGRPPKNQEAE